VRVVAILACYNEERFIDGCIRQLVDDGVAVHLIDNASSDRTVEIAERHLGNGLLAIERLPRGDTYPWRRILVRKQELAASLDAEWVMHVDADEVRHSPTHGQKLAEALADVDRRGYTAVDFQEFTFVPTREHPDHDHPAFGETMRWYYPLQRAPHQQVKAWKRQDAPVDLVSSAGHRVSFPGARVYPESFPMRHYLFLSVEHALRKYVARRYDPDEVNDGWHTARAALRAEDISLLSGSDLRVLDANGTLDATDPWPRHPLFAGNS
jgi:glycosyltransferase involved in cell wall biosynthesis